MQLKPMLMTVTCALLTLSACNQTPATNTPSTAAPVSGQANASAPSGSRDLTIASWGGTYQDAQREIYFKPFSDKIGKPVLDENYDGGYGVLQAKVQSGNPNWDVVQVEGATLASACEDGLLEPLDWEKLGGKDAYLPTAVNDCGVGAIVVSSVIAYDGNKIKTGPNSWADFWDVEKFPGKRALRKTPTYTLEFALMADGVPAQKVYEVLGTEAGVAQAFKKLDEIKPHVLWWESGAQPLQLLVSNEVTMASVYNGRIAGLNQKEGTNFKIVWPQSMYSIDSWAILKGAANKDAGMDFIAFASLPENQVKLPEFMAYGLPHKQAAANVAEKYATELPTYAPNIEQALAFSAAFWGDHSEELTPRFNAWVAK